MFLHKCSSAPAPRKPQRPSTRFASAHIQNLPTLSTMQLSRATQTLEYDNITATSLSAPSQKKGSRPAIPSYLLTDILVYLDIYQLQRCRAVCREWNYTIINRKIFRPRLFLQPPSPRDDLTTPVTIHPVLRYLQSDWAQINGPISIHPPKPTWRNVPVSIQDKCNIDYLHLLPVKDSFATYPALKKFVIVIPCHMEVVEKEEGVTVWDIVTGLRRLIEALSKIEALRYDEGCVAKLSFRQLNTARKETFNTKFIVQFHF